MLAHSPSSDAQELALTAPIVITFTEEIGPLTLNLALTPPIGPAGWHAAWNDAGTVATITHGGLVPSQAYTVEVMARDAWVNPMTAAHSWSFATIERWQIYLPVVVRNQ